MRKAFVVTEALVIAIISALAGFYIEKNTQITNHIYNSDGNKTVILWTEHND